MLVIGRKLNESLVLELGGDEIIEIKVTEIGNQVRLGIDAPSRMHIWRKELYLTLLENKQAQEAAASVSVEDLHSLARNIKIRKG